MLRNLVARPAALRCLRLAVPPVRLCSSLLTGPTPARRPGVLPSDNPKSLIRVETTRPPRFLENPCARALLSDPDGTSAPGRHDASVLPSAFGTASAPAITLLTGLNHTAHAPAVYASPCRSPEHDARLAPRWVANPSWTGLTPARLRRKVSAHASSFPRLCLAQTERTHSPPARGV
jgi:hypothetical protein